MKNKEEIKAGISAVYQKIEDNREQTKEELHSSRKSDDISDYVDRFFHDPVGLFFSNIFIKLGVSPNAISILSVLFGVAGGILFYPRDIRLNILGILLHTFSAVLDSSDGQVARLTGNTSQLGRVLDGLTDGVNFAAVYLALGFRMMGEVIPFSGGKLWGGLIWLPVLFCGIISHASQARLADYIRTVHLFFEKGSELPRSSELEKEYEAMESGADSLYKLFLFFYIRYTRLQEKATPKMQRLLAAYTSENDGPRSAADAFVDRSVRYIQLTNMLTYSLRAYLLYVMLLLNLQSFYFPIIIVVFGALKHFTLYVYEKISGEILCRYYGNAEEIAAGKRKIRYRLLFFIIGLAGVVFLFIKTKPGLEDWQTLFTGRLPLLLVGLLLLWAVIYILHMEAFRLVIGEDSSKIHRMQLLRICVAGFALNSVTPLGMVGGEPYRIMELKRYLSTEKATSSTLTFSVLYVIGHVLIWLTGIICYLIMGCPGEPFVTVLLLIVMMLLLSVCYILFNQKRTGMILPVLHFLQKLPVLKKPVSGLLEKFGDKIAEIDSVYVSFRSEPKIFYKVTAYEYAARILECLEYYLIFRYLGEPITPLGGLMVLSMASLIGNLLFVVPMQVGAREGGMTIALGWLGIDAASGMIGGLIYRVRDLICIAIGIICILADRDTADKDSTA